MANARTFHEVVQLNYGDANPKTGWYLQRVTVTQRPSGEYSNVVERKPLAMFVGSGHDPALMARDFLDEVRDKTMVILPTGWTIKDLPK